MAAKDILGEESEKTPQWFGTKVSGYTEVPVEKRCGTCEYLVKGKLCNHKIVLTDKKVKTDKKSGLKMVDPVDGCCTYWEPEEA